MEDSRTATFDRKRRHEITISDDTSNAGSTKSTPRKRVKHAGKVGHQDLRDFVPSGANFSQSVISIDDDRDSVDGSVLGDLDGENDEGSPGIAYVDNGEGDEDLAVNEGRRIYIGNLSGLATEADVRNFLDGYSIERITIHQTAMPGTGEQDDQPVNISTADTTLSLNSADAPISNQGRRLENDFISVNPRTQRHDGFALVDLTTSDNADSATSQLSSKQILARKVSVQSARKSDPPAPGIATKEDEVNPSEDAKNKWVNEDEEEVTETKEPELASHTRIGPTSALNWNSVNKIKIRTTLGGHLGQGNTNLREVVRPLQEPQAVEGTGKDKIAQDEPFEKNEDVQSPRQHATQLALTRLEGLRDRLAGMDPHDGPVSAYKAAKTEMENAEVDLNYCLYYPVNEDFSPPPSAPRRTPEKASTATQQKRARIWNLTKKCMVEGTLEELKDGNLTKSGAREMDQNASTKQTVSPRYTTYPENLDSKQSQAFETQTVSEHLQGLLETVSNLPESDSLPEQLTKKIEEAQANMYYCLNFPSNEEYLSLSLVEKGLREPESAENDEAASSRRAAQIWKLAQQCALDDTLQDLSAGRLSHRVKDFAVGGMRNETVADGLTVQKMPQEMESHQVSLSGTIAAGNRTRSKSSPGPGNVIELSSDLGEPNDVDRKHSESDGGLVLNTFNDQDVLSEGEVSHDQELDHMTGESHRRMTETHTSEGKADDEITDEDSDPDMEDDSESEDVDAMMDYSNSEQAVGNIAIHSQSTDQPQPRDARILAELSSTDLSIQLRYFHVGRSSNEVDPNSLVKCLVCAQHGHAAEACEALTCGVCGAYNNHITQNCPSTTKCLKCREMGHDRAHCPYRLKNMALNEIICDLCLRNGHTEQDCELVWRTSGRPWDFDSAKENVRLSCYECGRSGHLGNDCPTRRPGKSLGSSTWGSGKDQVSIKSKNEIRIKGSARQNPIDLDDGDDELERSFFRPRVSEPPRKPKFQIKTGPTASFPNQGSSAWNPINGSQDRGRSTQQHNDHYRDDNRGRWSVANGLDRPVPYTRSGYNDYQPNDRRSISPQYRDRNGYARSDEYQTSVPQPMNPIRRPPPRNDTYRPMPSSAQNAWSRYRM